MSKLPTGKQFLDVSDYGRPAAKAIVRVLAPTPVSSLHLTYAFLLVGCAAIISTANGYHVYAAILLVCKSVLDAADGEMARFRKQPSQTGRYLDSIFDYLINFGLLYVIYATSGASLVIFIAAFVSIEFQGTIFSYYYLVQRAALQGDTTSVVNEFEKRPALPGDTPAVVNVLRKIYLLLYGPYDWLMLKLDPRAADGIILPNVFLSVVSFFGLGFQLLVIGILMVAGQVDLVLPFFVWLNILAFVLVFGRRILMR